MIRNYGIIRDSARRVADAIAHSTDALVEGRIEQEPAFTDRMLGAIEQAMREFRIKGVSWTAKTLTDRGRGSQEKKYGADFIGVLSIALPNFSVKKGFLAQAKMTNKRFDANELRVQCERMLQLSPASFVFLYGLRGVSVVPAISVIGSRREPDALYSKTAAQFFEEHFESFIGDRAISAATPEALEDLLRRYESHSLLYLQAGIETPEEFIE